MGNPFNWLADRTGIHPSQVAHGVGNVLDNKWTKGALALGLGATGVGAPLGALIMGGEGLLGGALHPGGGLRDALSSGAQGAAIGGMAGGAGSALRNAFAPSSAGASFGAGAPSAGGSAAEGMSSVAMPAMTAPPIGATGSSLAESVGGALKGAGSFAAHNPNAVGAGLLGVGAISSRNATNAAMNAQTEASQYDLEQKKRRDASLDPLRQLLSGQMGAFMQNNRGVAPNPYAQPGQSGAMNPYLARG